uniref:PD-(D/E)XK nuclease family protein n=1 Tax=Halopseudomonas sp. TaxID=2901191 RepID=UPI0035696B28
RWWIGSYSALTGGHDTDYFADDKEDIFAPIRPGETATMHRFPRGPQPGTFLHGLLELAAEEGFARFADQAYCAERVYPRCQRRNWNEWGNCLTDWLGSLLAFGGLVPQSGLSLADLQPGQYQSEMQFLFAAHGVSAEAIDQLVRAHTLDSADRPALGRDQLNGLFKGFIDLVFEHEGRYWVLDYKSNWLGKDAAAYSEDAMRKAVLEHRYDLQYVFYVLALHRQLRARLADYDYDRHMGGAAYWFIRGVEAHNGGLWHTRPPRELIEGLDRLFAGQTLEAAHV